MFKWTMVYLIKASQIRCHKFKKIMVYLIRSSKINQYKFNKLMGHQPFILKMMTHGNV